MGVREKRQINDQAADGSRAVGTKPIHCCDWEVELRRGMLNSRLSSPSSFFCVFKRYLTTLYHRGAGDNVYVRACVFCTS